MKKIFYFVATIIAGQIIISCVDDVFADDIQSTDYSQLAFQIEQLESRITELEQLDDRITKLEQQIGDVNNDNTLGSFEERIAALEQMMDSNNSDEIEDDYPYGYIYQHNRCKEFSYYDTNGNITGVVTYLYDELNRSAGYEYYYPQQNTSQKTKVTYSGNTATTYSYDENGNEYIYLITNY